MKKSDMSSEQLAQLEIVNSSLKSTGWIGRTTNELLAKGMWMPQEAVYDYTNGKIHLMFMYGAERQAIDFIIVDSMTEASKRINLVIEFADKLAELLNLIDSFKDKITFDTYKGYFEQILQLLPGKVFLFQNDQRIPLVSNN